MVLLEALRLYSPVNTIVQAGITRYEVRSRNDF